jgi:hypothetical protein
MLKTTGVLCEGFCVEFKPVKGCEQTGVAWIRDWIFFG